jgi:monomeric isocitrate dehydrogenase
MTPTDPNGADAPGVKKSAKIWWTLTDEAPALATHAFLPVVRRFCGGVGVSVESADISLASRVLAAFPERLTPAQRKTDVLAKLGELATTERANIIKLPNVSASGAFCTKVFHPSLQYPFSTFDRVPFQLTGDFFLYGMECLSVPQLESCVAELKSKGYDLPKYPGKANAETMDAETLSIATRYAKIFGSAVNPVLREGNSDRRVAPPVKDFAKKNPHRLADWRADSSTRVASMSDGDFYGSEKSWTNESREPATLRVELHAKGDGGGGVIQTLKRSVVALPGEIVDVATMSAEKLAAFAEETLRQARSVLLLRYTGPHTTAFVVGAVNAVP